MKHEPDSRPQAASSAQRQQLVNTIELSLCHVGELIDMAQEIACEMQVGPGEVEAILKISGRLSTLMYCAGREVHQAQIAVSALSA